MQALILEAEGEPVGDYILDLYDLHLHNVLGGSRAGKGGKGPEQNRLGQLPASAVHAELRGRRLYGRCAVP